jgi:hypothetical protein
MASYLMRIDNRHRTVKEESNETSTRWTSRPSIKWISHLDFVEISTVNLFNNIQYPNRVAVGIDTPFNLLANTTILAGTALGATVNIVIPAGAYTNLTLAQAIQTAFTAAMPSVSCNINVSRTNEGFPPGIAPFVFCQLSFSSQVNSFWIQRHPLLGFFTSGGDPLLTPQYTINNVPFDPSDKAVYDMHKAIALIPESPIYTYFFGPARDQEIFLDYTSTAGPFPGPEYLNVNYQAICDNVWGAGNVQISSNIEAKANIDPLITQKTQFKLYLNAHVVAGGPIRFFTYIRGFHSAAGTKLTTAFQFGLYKFTGFVYPISASVGSDGFFYTDAMVDFGSPREIFVEATIGQNPRLVDDDGGSTYKIISCFQNNAPRGSSVQYIVRTQYGQESKLTTSDMPQSVDTIKIRLLGGPDMDELVADEALPVELVYRVTTTQVLEA